MSMRPTYRQGCKSLWKAWLLSGILLLSLSGLAQDLHSSQSWAISPVFNPAATGHFNGLWRAGLVYRDQYRTVTTPYQTLGMFGEWSTYTNSRSKKNRFGLGLIATADRAGDGRLTTTEFGLQTAYHQTLARDGRVTASVGFGAHYGSRRLDVARLIFNSQWGDDLFDPNIPSGENFASDRAGYLDLNAGFRIFARTSVHNYLLFEGALHHINQPSISFLGEDVPLGLRPVAAVSGRFGLRGTTSILPRVSFSTERQAREIIAGANFTIGLDHRPDADQFILGAWYRYADAFIITAGMDYRNARFVLSYDVNASKLTPASKGNGAFELSLVLIGRKPSKVLDCPRDF